MSFNPSIPLVTDPILLSNYQIRANFQAIAAAFASNHTRLNGTGGLPGNHTVLTMRPQAVDPVTDANQIALYNKIVTFPEIFFMPRNAQTPIQLTYDSLKTDGTNTQYSFVAGPFIVYMGRIDNVAVGQVVNLTPGTTLLYVTLFTAFSKGLLTGLSPIIPVPPAPIPINVVGTSFTISNQNFVVDSNSRLDIFYTAVGV